MAKQYNPASVSLLSLDAVAFDCETTGLDTRKARMIQLGGVRIVHGKVDEAQNFQQLINPGIHIPSASQAIHGISDIDVVDATDFVEVVNAFENWRQNSLLVGYAAGFDLAMLKREYELANLEWITPRCLDVRFLVNLLAPNLPDFSLDTIAGWAGVEIHHRHSALGDAMATGAIFLALIPKLRERGIRTLAEVERACDKFSEASMHESRMGWLDVLETKSMRTPLARIDSFPYRHCLRDLMKSPALFIDPKQSLRMSLAMLMDHEVSSLFVHPLEPGGSPGIITERDLLRKFYTSGDAAFDLSVGDIAVYPLVSLHADAFVYRAIARMKRLHIGHLGVHDNHGEIVGALSVRDLLRQRADDAIALGDDIDTAESAAQMSQAWGNIALVAKSLVAEDVDGRDVAAVISHELRALTCQACIIAEQEMPDPPPCPYAMLVLGSGGRGESLLAMDQDNAIVYAQGEAGGYEDQWFIELGTKVSDILDAAGVPYCKGNIMASNPEWCLSLVGWQELLQIWVRCQSPEDILNCDIFFDAQVVHGDTQLAGSLLDYAFDIGRGSKQFIKLMSINACRNSHPLGLFGRFKLDQGRMDLKMGGILPLFATARVLAIQHDLRHYSTPSRYEEFSSKTKQMQSTVENLSEAHRFLLQAILEQQLIDLEAGIPLSNRVAPNQLSSSMREQLNWALEQVPNVSNLLGDPLSGI